MKKVTPYDKIRLLYSEKLSYKFSNPRTSLVNLTHKFREKTDPLFSEYEKITSRFKIALCHHTEVKLHISFILSMKQKKRE